MSRTLFAYIFKDLFKIFVMASGALAGIMSFGGLLRPLTREGLDAGQVSRMLLYFGPAMTTYSFPVAALFATAVVYGRLAADNELTACKAGGISLLSLTVSGPALVLGLIVAITSLLFLCFVVPASTLRVEKVIYSNLAKLVQSRIERNHQIELENTTIFAQEAHVVLPEAKVEKVQLSLFGMPLPLWGALVPQSAREELQQRQGKIQRISFNGAVRGGNYTVTYNGTPGFPEKVTTGNVKFISGIDAYNALALEQALNTALAGSGPQGPAVSVAPDGPGAYAVTFKRALASTAINLMTVNTSGLHSRQLVEMLGVEIISVEHDPADKSLLVPKEFYTASRAYVYIDPTADGEKVVVSVTLQGGFKFPRRYEGATVAGITTTQYGPISIPSPIKEDVKFMNVVKLKHLYADLGKSRKLQAIISQIVQNGQRNLFLDELFTDLRNKREAKFKIAQESYAPRFRFFDMPILHRLNVEKSSYYSLTLEEHGTPARGPNEVTAAGPLAHLKEAPPAAGTEPPPQLPTNQAPTTQSVATESINRPIIFREEAEGREPLIVLASSVLVHAQPLTEDEKVHVTISLKDCLQLTRSSGQGNFMARGKYDQSFEFPMSAAARAMAGQNVAYYEENADALRSPGERMQLLHDKTALINAIIAESNGRASFAISCLILVMLGSALGMMFRSGDFLTAFAVSFIPALLSITLIIAGQRTAGSVPFRLDKPGASNPLQLGLSLIWTGNAIDFLLALGLLWKLGRR